MVRKKGEGGTLVILMGLRIFFLFIYLFFFMSNLFQLMYLHSIPYLGRIEYIFIRPLNLNMFFYHKFLFCILYVLYCPIYKEDMSTGMFLIFFYMAYPFKCNVCLSVKKIQIKDGVVLESLETKCVLQEMYFFNYLNHFLYKIFFYYYSTSLVILVT